MNINREVFTKTTTTLKLTSYDIVELLKGSGLIPVESIAKATFLVPGGGDWSGMTVNIDSENYVSVTFEEEDRKETNV